MLGELTSMALLITTNPTSPPERTLAALLLLLLSLSFGLYAVYSRLTR